MPDAPPNLDPRSSAFRLDLADARLKGQVPAAQFVDGQPYRVTVPTAVFRGGPTDQGPRIATKLFGEPLRVFEVREGWVWAQSTVDGYVGYLRSEAVAEGWLEGYRVVSALRSHIYRSPDIKATPTSWVPHGARVQVARPILEENRLIALEDGGWIAAAHLAAPGHKVADWVTEAARFIGAPYLWGGDSVEGIDCSGLIARALHASGRDCPRDSDQQEAALGRPLGADALWRRGDLVFWNGHVGVISSAAPEGGLEGAVLLHANAYAMAVSEEPAGPAIARIEALGGGPVTSRRRFDDNGAAGDAD